MVQDRATVTMANPSKVIHGLSNRAILNDLERPRTNPDFKVRSFVGVECLRNG